jgi:hypothetical protein
MTGEAFDTVRTELKSYIDAMEEDEQCDLVALTWVSRGDLAGDEWTTAVKRGASL